MVESRRALVTGGAGFIGSHLVDRLLAEGFRVAIIDDLSAGKIQNLNSAATFYHADITSAAAEEIFCREQPDLVFHLAARVSVVNSTRNPVDNAEVNVIGTLKLLETARKIGLEKFVFASTGGAIYGNPEDNPCSEKTPVEPVSPYGLSKHICEQYIALYHRLYRLNFTNLRYGNVYGPRQDAFGEAGVIPIFIQAMLEGNRPRMFGDGDQERDFIYVDDIVEANIQAIHGGHNRTMNIGTGVGTSINRLYEVLKGHLEFHHEAKRRPRRHGDVHKIYLDCAKALEHLGWSPKVALEEGLRKTVEYYGGEAVPGRRSA
jgi:UDP-glucose 4-epimerase